jgi:hypothetical protein
MPEPILINVEVNLESKKMIRVEERIRVPKNSSVIWNLKLPEHFFEELYYLKWTNQRRVQNGLIFTVYFENETPFQWKRESLRFPSNRPIPASILDNIYELYNRDQPERQEFLIAEGVAEKTGDFKYGIKVSEVGNDEPIYDEDPYLVVF